MATHFSNDDESPPDKPSDFPDVASALEAFPVGTEVVPLEGGVPRTHPNTGLEMPLVVSGAEVRLILKDKDGYGISVWRPSEVKFARTLTNQELARLVLSFGDNNEAAELLAKRVLEMEDA